MCAKDPEHASKKNFSEHAHFEITQMLVRRKKINSIKKGKRKPCIVWVFFSHQIHFRKMEKSEIFLKRRESSSQRDS